MCLRTGPKTRGMRLCCDLLRGLAGRRRTALGTTRSPDCSTEALGATMPPWLRMRRRRRLRMLLSGCVAWLEVEALVPVSRGEELFVRSV